MTELSGKFMKLFSGLDRAYGTYVLKEEDKYREDGKVLGKATTIREPVTKELWEKHLNGEQGIGIVPINDDNKCVFGAIDIDDYTFENYDRILAKINELGFPLFPCRSKSGGLHIYLFTDTWVPASLMQKKLTAMASMLGFGTSEIFPKQTEIIAERGDIGGWINMPYFNAKNTDRYLVNFGNEAYKVSRFLDMALENRIPEYRLESYCKAKEEILKGGPPCLEILLSQGVPSGNRNNVLFNIGVYLRKAYPETWQNEIALSNAKFMKPPLSKEEVDNTIKSLKRKEYDYSCKRPPIQDHCNSGLCRLKKHGCFKDGNMPALSGLTKFNSDPPTWFVNVADGGRMELATEDLQSQKKFQKRCMDTLNCMPKLMKEIEWNILVSSLLADVQIIEAPSEASSDGLLLGYIEDFLTKKVQGKSKNDILNGKVWYDVDAGEYCFRIKDFMDYLTRRNIRGYAGKTICSKLHNEPNFEHKGINLHDPNEPNPSNANRKRVNIYAVKGLTPPVHKSFKIEKPDDII